MQGQDKNDRISQPGRWNTGPVEDGGGSLSDRLGDAPNIPHFRHRVRALGHLVPVGTDSRAPLWSNGGREREGEAGPWRREGVVAPLMVECGDELAQTEPWAVVLWARFSARVRGREMEGPT